ncbi:MAG: lamin tail domain-containing protein [Anaerohalosphaeraceae bacterium]
MKTITFLFIGLVCCAYAPATMRITEWMYGGANGEFVEFTNVGSTPIDLTGWSYDDDNRRPGQFSLSPFGIVAPGESVIITESAAASFRTAWGLSSSVKILGGYTNNLGRNDEINLYDALGNLVDRLTFGDQNFPGSIRTLNKSGNIPPAKLGQNDVYSAVLSAVNDEYGSFASTGGDIGNPGYYIPEPTTFALLAAAGALALRKKR